LFNIFNSNKDKLRIENINNLEEEIKDLKLKIALINTKIEDNKHKKSIVDSFESKEIVNSNNPWYGFPPRFTFDFFNNGTIELDERIDDKTNRITVIKKEDVKLLLTLLDYNREILGE
jgi:hypothetical protein